MATQISKKRKVLHFVLIITYYCCANIFLTFYVFHIIAYMLILRSQVGDDCGQNVDIG